MVVVRVELARFSGRPRALVKGVHRAQITLPYPEVWQTNGVLPKALAFFTQA